MSRFVLDHIGQQPLLVEPREHIKRELLNRFRHLPVVIMLPLYGDFLLVGVSSLIQIMKSPKCRKALCTVKCLCHVVKGRILRPVRVVPHSHPDEIDPALTKLRKRIDVLHPPCGISPIFLFVDIREVGPIIINGPMIRTVWLLGLGLWKRALKFIFILYIEGI